MRTSVLKRFARSFTTCVVSATGFLPVCSAQDPLPPAPSLSAPSAIPDPAPRAVKAPPVRPPAPADHVYHISQQKTKVSITQLQSRIIELPNRIQVVTDFNEETLEVAALTSNRVRVFAKSPGATSITLIDEFDNSFVVDVFVEADVRELQAYMERLFPGSAVEVLALRDSVVLRGWVTEPDRIPQMIAVAKQFYPVVHNQMQVGGVTQVQLHVKVMEVQRSKLEKMGINWLGLGRNFYVHSAPGSLAPLASAPIQSNGGLFTPAPTVNTPGIANSAMQFAVTGSSGFFQAFVDVLRTENLAKILAEPVLVTTSGRPATMLSGGEFPVLVPGGVGTTTIQYKEFGVRMEAVPIVLGNGRLRLDISPEVSQRDVQNAVQVNGFTVFGVVTRRVNTQVEMRFGETLMIGGLISQSKTNVANKIPFLGELPWVGAAFRRTQAEWGETELLILVTPHMAAPMQPGQEVCGGLGNNSSHPVTSELFLDGMIEVPYYGPECPDGVCPPEMACPPQGMMMPGGPQETLTPEMVAPGQISLPDPPAHSLNEFESGTAVPQDGGPSELIPIEKMSGSGVTANRGGVVQAEGRMQRSSAGRSPQLDTETDTLSRQAKYPTQSAPSGLIRPNSTSKSKNTNH